MKSSGIVFTLLVLFLNTKADKLLFELKEDLRFPAQEVFPLDIKSDGVDELLIIYSNHITLSDQKGRFFWDFYFDALPPKVFSINDFNQDGVKEYFQNYTKGLTQILNCYRPNKSGDLIKTIKTIKGNDKNKDGKWDGGIKVIGGIDANNDNNKDLLLSVGCSFDLQPRGVAVFDMVTGDELWHYFIGPSPENIVVEDLDNDNKPEIIIETYSPGNGSEANNTNDTMCYVIVLNNKGELIWQKEIGQVFTLAQVITCDLDNDGNKELIVAKSSRTAETVESDKLFILEGITGKEKNLKSIGENFRGLVYTDLYGNGVNDIITGNSDGRLRVFDVNLDLFSSYKYRTGIEVMAALDLNGDDRNEIITNTDDNLLIIFDEKLKKLAEMKLEKNISYGRFNENFGMIKPVRFGRTKKLLINIPRETESDFVLYSFAPRTLVARQGLFFIPFVILVIVLIIILLHISVFRRFIDLQERIAKRFYSRVKKTGYAIINSKGIVLVANEKIEDLLDLMNLEGSNIFKRLKENKYDELYNKLLNLKQREETEIIINTEKGERVLSLNIYEMPKRGTYSLRVEDITLYKHLAKIESWAPVAQKLAHGVKTPLMNIQLAAQQLGTCHDPNDEKCVRLLENVNNEVKRLRKLTDGFIRFTQLTPPNFHLENINMIIKDLIDKYPISLPSGIKFRYEFDEKIPKLSLDKKEIENAFSILIDNAIEALGKHGTLTITTVFQQKFEERIKDWVRIEITDSGKGIPEKYMEEVFKPYFVYDKPDGTGLGLTIAKKIIENHNGEIELNSKEGLGTSVIIQLPIS